MFFYQTIINEDLSGTRVNKYTYRDSFHNISSFQEDRKVEYTNYSYNTCKASIILMSL